MANFDELYNLSSAADWDVGVSIHRTNPVPLDSTGIFMSLEDAQAYARGEKLNKNQDGATAYVGQILTVVDPDRQSVVGIYKIVDTTGKLEQIDEKFEPGDMPIATESQYGAVKIGYGIDVVSGLISVADGILTQITENTAKIAEVSSASQSSIKYDPSGDVVISSDLVFNGNMSLLDIVSRVDRELASHEEAIGYLQSDISDVQGDLADINSQLTAIQNASFIGENGLSVEGTLMNRVIKIGHTVKGKGIDAEPHRFVTEVSVDAHGHMVNGASREITVDDLCCLDNSIHWTCGDSDNT